MKAFFLFFIRSIIAIQVLAVTSLTAYFGFEETFLMSSLWGFAGGASSYLLLKWRGDRKLLNRNQITRKEYRYIQNNLKEAHIKIKRLNKSLLGVRSIQAARRIGKLQRLVNKIYHIIKEEPKRFFISERFFFYHLDSIVELTERYIFLTRQQVKDVDVKKSLSDTERTLDKLTASIEDDLMTILADDLEHLNMELEVANYSIDREKQLLPDERSQRHEEGK